MKAIIGLTTFLGGKSRSFFSSVNDSYIYSVSAGGGVPVNIPISHNEEDYDSYIEILDGILFTGGDDIVPIYYGENPLKEVDSICSVRDEHEFKLFKKAYERKMPMLGICRGAQLLNVALGGNLYQDINQQIPDSLGHYPTESADDELYHSVKIKKESKLGNIFGEEKMYVNSFHHQSVKKLGTNLIITALSEDGIIEGIESIEDRFLIGVQWHPECLTKRYPKFLKLFNGFIHAAIEYKQNRF
ncbi:MAG: gamma-glutamyl-gamma-aminobutyrate hydrolase family protein [Firmicutes bacterium]|nr:gamma-glutamyl-gamma-aminobutyrate hydrolase family protein [Bacillota bacterium]